MTQLKSFVEAQRECIIAWPALRHTRGNMDGAAYILQIGKSTLYRKLDRLEIRPEEWSTTVAAAGAGR